MSTEFESSTGAKVIKYIKLAIKVLIGVVVAIVLVAVTLYIIVDPNDYKKEIASLVKAETGYSIKINGNIALSVFPWTGVEVNDVEIKNPPGFTGKRLAHVARIDIKAKLIPLFTSRLEVSRINIRGLHLNLQVNRDGQANWEGAQNKLTGPKPARSKNDKVHFDINSVAITEANIIYANQKSGGQHSIANLNLETGNIGTGEFDALSLTFKYKSGKRRRSLRISYKSKLSLDTHSDTLFLRNVTLKLGSTTFRGYLQGTNVTSQPEFNGQIKSGELDLRALLLKLGMPMPKMQSKSALQKFSFDSLVRYKNKVITFGKIRATLDKSILTGSLTIRMGDTVPVVAFNINANQINVDNYMLAPVKGQRHSKKSSDINANAALIPTRLIRALRGNGLIRIKRMRALQLDSTNVQIRFVAKGGKLDIISSAGDFYGGKYKGHTVIDVNGKTPSLIIRESLRGVKGQALYKLLKPYLNYGKYLHDMYGTASVTADFRASGNSILALRRSLAGAVWFEVRNGQLHGINAVKTLCNYYNQSRGRSMIGGKEKSTGFEKLTGKFTVSKGKFFNDDFIMQTTRSLLRITGKGTGDFVRDTINYRFRTELLYSACDARQNTDDRKLEFVVGATGRLSSPKIRPDFKAMAKAAFKSKIIRKLNRKGGKYKQLRQLLNKKNDKKGHGNSKRNSKEETIRNLLNL